MLVKHFLKNRIFMYIVIFKAKVKQLNEQYNDFANQLRTLAFNEFGCLDFQSIAENDQEITLSYWPSMEHIKAWKAHPLHQQAQKLGKKYWYHSYTVQIVEIIKEYSINSENN